ncbi:MAG: type II secretion system F family protein [Candidatus Pacearchaeota archaeon]
MIDQLKRNIEAEIMMVREINRFYEWYENASSEEKRLYSQLMNSLVKRVKLLNESLPEILDSISLLKKLDSTTETPLAKISIQKEVEVLVSDRGKEEFLKELNINEQILKKVKQQQSRTKKKFAEFQTANLYGKIANKMFLSFSQRLVDEGSFKSLRLDVRKSNINILSTTYISMLFLSVLLAFFAGIFIMTFLIFFKVALIGFTVTSHTGDFFARFVKLSWLPFASSLATWILFYTYPGAEKKALGKRIEQELPFVVIHMGSISGSGIEPIEVFKIIATSKEYEFAGQEFRKVLNQTNLYGYDLSSALRNVSLSTPSQKLAELLNGMGVTINSGGDISKFFEKRADSLLLEYRLEREKATKSAETFMDLYISVVIATPMILLMLLVVIAVAKVETGFNASQLTITIMGVVAIVNILFLSFLHLKQPVY